MEFYNILRPFGISSNWKTFSPDLQQSFKEFQIAWMFYIFDN